MFQIIYVFCFSHAQAFILVNNRQICQSLNFEHVKFQPVENFKRLVTNSMMMLV